MPHALQNGHKQIMPHDAPTGQTHAQAPRHSDASAEVCTSLASRSFLGFLATQFFGAFNDNLFKQMLMLLSLPVVASVGVEIATAEIATAEIAGEVGRVGEADSAGGDVQGIVTVVFGLPFVFFGGLAGHLADKFSKRRVIIASKIGEIAIMGLGIAAFLAAPRIGFAGLWCVLFLMGLQSSFFGPGKYGILPEMIPRSKLDRANGWVLMTTFIAIIIGTAIAGPVKDALVSDAIPRFEAARQLWVGSLACVAIALVGTLCSLAIGPVKAAEPGTRLNLKNALIPSDVLRLLRRDRPLLGALFASCVFWLIAGLTLQAVNALGATQLRLSDTKTSLMVSLISIGIAFGGAAAGWITRRKSSKFVIQVGSWGIILWATVLSIDLPGHGHLLGFAGSVPVLILLGASAAFFALPIQVYLQDRPPEKLKGRMIAVVNQANFFAIVMAGVAYIVLNKIVEITGWPNSLIFAAMAVLFLPVAIFFRLDETPEPS